jgi:hypothetical protein
MNHSEFPPNNEASKRPKAENKNIERITSGEVVRRRKPLRKRFSETFIAGDAKTAVQYALYEIVFTAFRDMAVDSVNGITEKLFYGDTRRHRGITPPQTGPYGNVAYNRVSDPRAGRLPSAQRALSRMARARHDFDEIVLDDRSEAEDVIDRLFDLVSRYDEATVADLYELLGLGSTHPDHKWGWTNLQGAGVTRVRGGYLLDLPDPRPLE